MPKRTRSRERFPIGEWARRAKSKRLEVVEASKSLRQVEQQIAGATETIRILKDNNAQLQVEINELRRKVGNGKYWMKIREAANCVICVVRNDDRNDLWKSFLCMGLLFVSRLWIWTYIGPTNLFLKWMTFVILAALTSASFFSWYTWALTYGNSGFWMTSCNQLNNEYIQFQVSIALKNPWKFYNLSKNELHSSRP